MDKALVGMCVNERRLIKVPPQLAYGKEGYGKTVGLMCACINLDVVQFHDRMLFNGLSICKR